MLSNLHYRLLEVTYNFKSSIRQYTIKFEKLVLFNNDVDVACKFDIFKVEVVERLFKFAVDARSGLFMILPYIKLSNKKVSLKTSNILSALFF